MQFVPGHQSQRRGTQDPGNPSKFSSVPQEILAKIKSFADDESIVAFLEAFHGAIPDFSLRTYRLLEDLKKAGLDWQRYALDESDVPSRVKEIADLLTRFDNDIQRLEYYSASRRDYYNWKPQAVAYLERRVAAASPPLGRGLTIIPLRTEPAISVDLRGPSGAPVSPAASGDGVHSCTGESGTPRS